MNLHELLDDYETVVDRLTELYIERAESLAAELTTRANAYASLCAGGDKNITTIREEADFAAHPHKAEAIRLTGQIDAYTAKLRLLDMKLEHWDQTNA